MSLNETPNPIGTTPPKPTDSTKSSEALWRPQRDVGAPTAGSLPRKIADVQGRGADLDGVDRAVVVPSDLWIRVKACLRGVSELYAELGQGRADDLRNGARGLLCDIDVAVSADLIRPTAVADDDWLGCLDCPTPTDHSACSVCSFAPLGGTGAVAP